MTKESGVRSQGDQLRDNQSWQKGSNEFERLLTWTHWPWRLAGLGHNA